MKLKNDNEQITKTTRFIIEVDKSSMTISLDGDNDNYKSYIFPTHDTNSLENDLPFELVIKDNIENKLNKILEFNSKCK